MLEQREIDRWRRLTDAMLEHAANGDPAAFAQVVAILERARAKLPAVALELARPVRTMDAGDAGPYSWSAMAEALGVTRSAAWQRFGAHRVTVALSD